MHRTLIFDVFILTCIFSSLSFGSGIEDQVSLEPSWLYSAVKESCVHLTSRNIGAYYNVKTGSSFPGEKMTKLLSYIEQKSANEVFLKNNVTRQTDITKSILATSSVDQALAECYPDDLSMRKYYLETIQKADRTGKVGASVLAVVFLRGAGGLLTKIKGISEGAYAAITNIHPGLSWFAVASVLPLTKDQSSPPVIHEETADRLMNNPSTDQALNERLLSSLRSSYFIKRYKLTQIKKHLQSETDSTQVQLLTEQKLRIEIEITGLEKQIQAMAVN